MKIITIIKNAIGSALLTPTILAQTEAKIEVYEVFPENNQVKISWVISNIPMDKQWNGKLSSTALFGPTGIPNLNYNTGKYLLFRLSGRRTSGSDKKWKIMDEQTLASWLPKADIQHSTTEGTYTYQDIDNGKSPTNEALRTRADWTYQWGIRTNGGLNNNTGTSTNTDRSYAWMRRTWQAKNILSGVKEGPLEVTLTPTRIALGQGNKPSYGPTLINSNKPHMQLALPGPTATTDPKFLEKRRGTETIEIYMNPINPELPNGLLIKRFEIEVYPQTKSTLIITGDKKNKEADGTPIIKEKLPEIIINNQNIYPKHLTYAQIYKGKPGTGTNPYIFPSSFNMQEEPNPINITFGVPNDEIIPLLTDTNYNKGTKDGYWTIEYIHAIPTTEGIKQQNPLMIIPGTTEIINTYTFKLDSTLKIRGIINQTNK